MSASPERRGTPQPTAEAAGSAMEPSTSAKPEQPPSPTRSDKSTESEGRPVREKLQETRIDGQSSSDPPPSSDQPMKDAPNGTVTLATGPADSSTSGSDSERGRLRRKRSREDFEDETGAERQPEKKQERHTRKKSRDIASPQESDPESLTKSAKASVPRIDEHDGDNSMVSTETVPRQPTPDTGASANDLDSVISPKNKRTIEQTADSSFDPPVLTVENGRDAKRKRDQSESKASMEASQNKSKVLVGSGFANTSVASPFTAASSKPQSPEAPGAAIDAPRTSDDQFKTSGFSSFSSVGASPFTLGGSTSQSPFAAPGGNSKLSSFSSPTKVSTTPASGFGALSGSNSSGFGSVSLAPPATKSGFAGTLGSSAFGSLGGTKSGLASFATPGATGITGLSQKTDKFGSFRKEESEDSGDSGDEDEAKEDTEKGKDGTDPKSPSHNVLPGPVETGEEGEESIWTGRAKLYTLAGESGNKQWQERGTGPFRFNITTDEPTRARFVLRADGTHRLLLNVAVTKALLFGDPGGNEPTDGKILFTAPATDGQLESHLLKLKPDKARELYKEVKSVQEETL